MTHKCCEVVVYGLALVINDYQHCKSPLPPPHTHKQTNLKNNGLLNMAAHAGNTIYSRHWLKDYANSEFKCRRLLLLLKCYNLYKVLACSTTFFQVSLLCATFFQLLMFMLFISSKTSSSQRVLGLPIGLLDNGFHLLIFCKILSSAMRSTRPNQFNLCFLINPIIFSTFYYIIYFLISFNPPAGIICSCRTNYFSHDLSFKSHQFICHIFFKCPHFGSVSYCWAN